MSKISLLFICCCLAALAGRAQAPVSLQAATDTALRNNLSLRSERLNAGYLKSLRGTARDIAPTGIGGEYGQINSPLADSKIGITQTLKFPAVYARQKALLDAEWQRGLAHVALKETDLKRRVAQAFYELLYLQQKAALLRSSDSIYSAFLQRALLRFKAGETNILEKTTAETQRAAAYRQLAQVRSDSAIAALQFKVLLNTETDFVPLDDNSASTQLPHAITDSALVRRHPYLLLLQSDRNVALATQKAEQARLLPELTAGYYNQSFRGVQSISGQLRTFDAGNRFSYVQAGIGIPIFAGAQRARVRAAGIGIARAEAAYEAGVQAQELQYGMALQQYNAALETVDYYKHTGLKAAETILSAAMLQLRAGDINYLNWVMLVNQSISIRNEYIEAARSLHQSIIALNTLTGN